MRIPSALLPRRVSYFSDGITPSYRSWPTQWPRGTVLALLKTRNQANPRSISHLPRNRSFFGAFEVLSLILQGILVWKYQCRMTKRKKTEAPRLSHSVSSHVPSCEAEMNVRRTHVNSCLP